jgi:hypothetical protein
MAPGTALQKLTTMYDCKSVQAGQGDNFLDNLLDNLLNYQDGIGVAGEAGAGAGSGGRAQEQGRQAAAGVDRRTRGYRQS